MLLIFLGLLFFVLPLGQLERIPLPNPAIGLYLHDVLLVIFVLVFLLRSNKKINLSVLAKTWLAFGLVCLVSFLSAFIRQGDGLLPFLYLSRLWLYLLFFICLENMQIPHQKKIIKLGLFFWGFMLVFTGILQYFFFPSALNLTVYGWDPHYFRVFGTLLDPGYLGLLLVLFLIFLFEQKNIVKSLKVKFIFGFFSYLTLALTYSRSSYLSFLAAIGVIAYGKKSWKLAIIGFLVLGLTLVFLPRPDGEGVKLERTASIISRAQNWQKSWQFFLKQPILGAGFNFLNQDSGLEKKNFLPVSHAQFGADNSFLFILATSGLIGLGVFCMLLVKIWQSVFLRPALAAILVHSLFNNSFFYPFILLWLLFLLSLRECK